MSPVVAQVLKQIPIISSVLAAAGDPGHKQAITSGFGSQVDQTVSDNGIKVTVTEVLFDGARLSSDMLKSPF